MTVFKTIAGLISFALVVYSFPICGGTSGFLLSAFLILYGVAAILTRKGYVAGKIKTESYILFFC